MKGNFKIYGTVTEGKKIGRELGFPTANIVVPDDNGIPDGVYAVEVSVDGGPSRQGMANLGRRPSVGGRGRFLEVNLFGTDRDLYGARLEVTLLKYIREEKRFGSLKELRGQLEKDRREIEAFFKTI